LGGLSVAGRRGERRKIMRGNECNSETKEEEQI
jgi:hypothetical protein